MAIEFAFGFFVTNLDAKSEEISRKRILIHIHIFLSGDHSLCVT